MRSYRQRMTPTDHSVKRGIAPLSYFQCAPLHESITTFTDDHVYLANASLEPSGNRQISSSKDIQTQWRAKTPNAYFDSNENGNCTESARNSLHPGTINMDQNKAKLAIKPTAQLLMISSRDSKEVFQSLWKICIALKKDPQHHIPFNDKLLKHDHVEEFLRLLGFFKDKSSSRWSCSAHTRVPISLIDTAISECHKCRQIVQQRASTINLVNQHKREHSVTSSAHHLNVLPQPLFITGSSQSFSTKSTSIYSIAADEKNDGDSLQLYELIWGITHKDNVDPGAKDVLLLCYPLVTNAEDILYCLQARFFQDSHSTNLGLRNKTKYKKILSSFSVQKNVIELIKHWMMGYWDKDWSSDKKLMKFFKAFMKRIRKAYQSQKNQQPSIQGLRLIEMLENTIKTQISGTQIRSNTISAGDSENHGSALDNYSIGNKTRYKNTLSIISRGFSQKKLSKGSKNLFDRDVTSIVIAEQITLLQFNLFRKIHPRECLKQAWKNKKRKHKDAPNITQCIEAFNHLTKWIQSSILVASDVKSRGRTIGKWVKVEEGLLRLRNFQGLCAVYGGLASTPIYRLKQAWLYVSKKQITQHEEINIIMKSSGNWRNLRSLQLQSYLPMIPYFGMFAQDMIAIEETTNNRNNDGSINWDALCRAQAAIDKHLINQNSPYNDVNADLSIKRWMNKELKMSGKLDDEWIYQVSDMVKLNDKRELDRDTKKNTSKPRKGISFPKFLKRQKTI